MKRSSGFFGALVLSAAVLKGQSPTVVGSAESYGLGFQATHIGAAAFHPTTPASQYVLQTFTSGYLNSNDSITRYYVAPVTLASGAEIHSLCVYAYDANPNLGVRVQLKATKLVPGGVSQGVEEISTPITTNWDTGAGVICADIVPPYVYTETSDQDGVFLAHYLEVFLQPSTGIGGVKILWRRTVSPPPATATFPDVPTNHPFFQYVEALYAAGITGGYGNGFYGVNDPVSRGQMAVFLAKALGLHSPG